MTAAGSEATATAEEEVANSLTHGVGLIGAICMAPVLIVNAVTRGGAADIVGASIFAGSLIVLYLVSTSYHAVKGASRKLALRRMDHGAIYVLIAGTYTPFTLGVLRGGWGWALFGAIWGAAVIGVAAKMARGIRRPRLSTAIYVAMGWSILVAIQPLVSRMPLAGLLWLVAGGLFYSIGTIFYSRPTRYAHAIWHLFVLAGSACHVVAVLGFAV